LLRPGGTHHFSARPPAEDWLASGNQQRNVRADLFSAQALVNSRIRLGNGKKLPVREISAE
jgi:hypothetical protein